MKFLQSLLGMLPLIGPAIQGFQAIGHSKETAVQKVTQSVQLAATIGEGIPVPGVAAISTIIADIASKLPETAAPTA